MSRTGPIGQSLETLRSVVRFDSVETDPVARRLARAASVDDLRGIVEVVRALG